MNVAQQARVSSSAVGLLRFRVSGSKNLKQGSKGDYIGEKYRGSLLGV